MPTYEYRCPEGHVFDVFQKMSDEPGAACPTCGAESERQISAGAGFLFKGSGFYITDYKRAGEPSGGDTPKSDSSGEGSKSEGKSEPTKPKSKPDSGTQSKKKGEG